MLEVQLGMQMFHRRPDRVTRPCPSLIVVAATQPGTPAREVKVAPGALSAYMAQSCLQARLVRVAAGA